MTERKKGDRADPAFTKLTKAHTPEFPEQLGPVARRVWDRLMPELIEKDHFKPGNEIGVVMICQLMRSGSRPPKHSRNTAR